MIEIENTFLLQLCQVLHEDDAPDLPFPDWMDNSILNIKCTCFWKIFENTDFMRLEIRLYFW